jgi:hypothetical protein
MAFQSNILTNEIVDCSDAPFLVDAIVPDGLLVLTFGFVSWNAPPRFDFYGRLKKLESLNGTPINKILVRDFANAWYHRPIAGLGGDVDEIATSLRKLIDVFSPRQVITIGQSMGGYAAILFGFLLGVDKILSFGPLSFLDSRSALSYHDRRWLAVMLELEKNPPPVGYFDLPALSRTADPNRTALHVFFGTKPDVDNATEAVNPDALHAARLAAYPNCALYPSPHSGHAIVQYLIDTKQINALLAHHVLGVDLPVAQPVHPLPVEWLSWIQENVQLGVPRQTLLHTLRDHGFGDDASASALGAVESQFFGSIC